MRGKNSVPTERFQLSLSENLAAVLAKLAELGLGKNKAEIATWIITDWVWNNADRLAKQGIFLRQQEKQKEALSADDEKV
ncbi:MAG: hypothetical protein WAL75_20765 [Terracidiphilus sp.]